MTTGMTKFTPQQWSVIAGAPLPPALGVVADRRGSMRATLAAVRAYRDARGSYDTELLRELLAAPPANANALRHEAPAALRQAIEIIDRVATTHEQAEIRACAEEVPAHAIFRVRRPRTRARGRGSGTPSAAGPRRRSYGRRRPRGP